MNTERTNLSQTPRRKYSFEAAYGSSDDTKEEACDDLALSKSIDKLQDDEMENLLDEIENGYKLKPTIAKEDELIAFGVNDEAIEEEETMIEDILDEIEEQEEVMTQIKTKLSIDGNCNESANAFKLRLHKQQTFGNILRMERIIAQYAAHKIDDEDSFINDADLFYCPPEMDYLLHGFIRNIMCDMVPQVVIRLVHLYYLCGNNRYYNACEAVREHRVIVQHPQCDLWRWIDDDWKQCNGDGLGQTTLLYDEVKGFTRLVHFDRDSSEMRCVQIIEANEAIDAANIRHNDALQLSAFVFGGFDFLAATAYSTQQRFKMQMIGPNHRYYCAQFVSCYNNIVESEVRDERLMLGAMDDDMAHDTVPSIEHLHEYVHGIQSRDDVAKHIKYSRLIRRLLSTESSPPIQEIIDCGIIQRLIYLMQYSLNAVVKFECAWSLTNIASGNREHTATLIRFNAIPALLNVFRHKDSIVEIKEQCLWALGNIAGDSVECRNQVLDADILAHLLPLIRPYRMLSQRQKTFMRNLVWTLSNLNRNKPLPASHHLTLSLHAMNIILSDAECNDNEVVQDCCWTLSYLSDCNDNDDSIASILLDSGLIHILIHILLDSSSDSIKHPALRTIGNIATGNDSLTNKLLNCDGILDAIQHLLQSQMCAIKRETLWLISNITAGDPRQIDAILSHDNVLRAICNLVNAEDHSVQREAVWALSNATSGGNDAQIRHICDNNGISALSHYVINAVNKQYYGNAFTVCLEGLQNMLHVGAHDALNNHQNPLLAVLGADDGTHNVYAIALQRAGTIDSMENALNDDKCPQHAKERCTAILDAFYPFRQRQQ